jgi:hypothetical protein
VFTRLIILEIHDAWPVCPISFLPLPRLLLSVLYSFVGFQGLSHLLPRRDPVLADIASVTSGSADAMAE